MPEVICTVCDKRKEAKLTPKRVPRTPQGWKLKDGVLLCKDCKNNAYCLRAVTLPVTAVIEGGTWKEFCDACKAAWRRSTDLANWAVNTLARNDVTRTRDMEHLPPMPPLNLYRCMNAGYPGRCDWAGEASSAASLLRAAQAKYSKRRFEVIWLGDSVLPTQRYPMPWPAHNQSWQASYHETIVHDKTDRVPAVRVRMGGRQWLLQLRSGYNVRKHLAGFGRIVDGSAIRGELALYAIPASRGCHRRVSESRPNSGGNAAQDRILCKMVAYLPRQNKVRELDGILKVETGKGCFIKAQIDGDNHPWTLRNNQVRGWIHRQGKIVQSIGDDLKAERRPRHERTAIQQHLDHACLVHHRRIDTFVKTTAAHLVAYAIRRKVEAIEYHDYSREYFGNRSDGRSGFPWAALLARIAANAKDAGIAFVHVKIAPEIVIVMEHKEELAFAWGPH